MNKTHYKWAIEVFEIVEVARKSPQFSPLFYQTLFERALELVQETGGAQDVVALKKLFSDKAGELEFRLESRMKEFIAQDAERLQPDELCTLLDMYRNDSQFKRFLAKVLLEKLQRGEKLEGHHLLNAVIRTLD